MPNRLIKDSICTSEKLASLSDFEFRVWVHLITLADDAGRVDARPAIIRGRAFPLREQVTSKSIDAALSRIATMDLAHPYTVGGKPFLLLHDWGDHQRIRESKPKYPGPDEADFDCSPQFAASCGELRPESNPIQSESNPNPESKIEAYASCSDPETASEPPVILLPLNDGSDYLVSKEQTKEWEILYPSVDVMQQLRNMKGWLSSNPTKRKTRKGILRFITSWLSREQDRGGPRKAQQDSTGRRDNVFLQMLEDERGGRV